MIDKKILAICIIQAAIMAGTVVYMTSVASDGENGTVSETTSLQQEIVEEWTSGDCTVTYYDDGSLVVTGNGRMADYTKDALPGWFGRWDGIQSVTVSYGVTHIGDCAFYGLSEARTVELSPTVTSIGESAFEAVVGITTLTIPPSVTSIGERAFYNETNTQVLDNIFFLTATWNLTIGPEAFDTGPMSATTNIYSPNNIANGNLITSRQVIYISSSQHTYTIGVNTSGYGTVSPASVQIWDGTNVVPDGNRLIFTDGQIVTATPTSSTAEYAYAFSDWTFGTLGQTANFTRSVQQYTLTFQVADERMGTVSVQTAKAPYGTNIAYTAAGHISTIPPQATFCVATPNVGFEFDRWDGVTLAPTTTTVTGDMTLTAYFKITLVNLTVQNGNPDYGSIDVSGTYQVSMFGTVTVEGNVLRYSDEYTSTDLTVTSTPNAQTDQYDYAFVGYDGVPEGGTVYMDTTITAQFSATVRQYTLTFNVNDPEMGDVDPSYVIDYGTQIQWDDITNNIIAFLPSQTISISIPIPRYGYQFDHWDGVAFYPDTTTVTGDMTITAYFDLIRLVMTISSNNPEYGEVINSGQYEISCFAVFTVDGNTLRVTDDKVSFDRTFTATPNAPTAQYTYRFDEWDGVPTGDITSEVLITAMFSRIVNTYTVTVNVNNPDWGSVDKDSVTVPYGTTMFVGNNVLNIGSEVVIATPAEAVSPYAYYFDSWSGVGTVWGDMTVTANFIRETSYTVTIQANNPTYGTVSVDSVMVPEGSEIYADGNRLMRTGAAPNLLSIATANPATDAEFYFFYGWRIPTGPVASDVTVYADFICADISTIDLMNDQYASILVPSAYSGATVHAEFIGVDGLTVEGGRITGQAKLTSDARAFIYYEKSTVPVGDWTAYYINFHLVTSVTIPLSQDAEQTLDENGVLVVLGRGTLNQGMCDRITPYRALIHTVDIRGLTNIQSMPYIDDKNYTLVLGDSVTTFTDRTGNHFGSLALGNSISSFNVTGFHAYDKNGNQISGTALRGRVMTETRTMAYTEIDYTETFNNYDNATCYAVRNSTLINSDNDRLGFRVKEISGLPAYLMSMIGGAGQSWSVNLPQGFKNVGINADGILYGIQCSETGTFIGEQSALFTDTQYGTMYSCTVFQTLAFNVFVQKELVIQ